MSEYTAFLQGHGPLFSNCNHLAVAVKAAVKYGFAGIGRNTFNLQVSRETRAAGAGLFIPDLSQHYEDILVRNASLCYKLDNVCSGLLLPGQVCTGNKKGKEPHLMLTRG